MEAIGDALPTPMYQATCGEDSKKCKENGLAPAVVVKR
jgi:hypothetical protein